MTMSSNLPPAALDSAAGSGENQVRLTLHLPLPSRMLSPHWRGAWTVAAAAKRQARSTAKREAMRLLEEIGLAPPRWAKGRLLAIGHQAHPRFPDPEEFVAALKAYLDGFAEAGLLAPDRDFWPDRPQFHLVESHPYLELTLEPDLADGVNIVPFS